MTKIFARRIQNEEGEWICQMVIPEGFDHLDDIIDALPEELLALPRVVLVDKSKVHVGEIKPTKQPKMPPPLRHIPSTVAIGLMGSPDHQSYTQAILGPGASGHHCSRCGKKIPKGRSGRKCKICRGVD